MIEVRDLTKTFGETRAVDGISFDVKAGEVLGFLGPNGAGKTTTMRVLTCYLPPTAGVVTVDGLDVETQSIEVRKRIGYLPESAPLYNDMNVVDYLMYVAEVRHIPKAKRRESVRHAIDVCGLRDVLPKNIGQLSSGYRQRVGLAQAIVHDPSILVLDEPTRGLDPNQIREIRALIRELGKHKTVIFSTHILPEVQAVCDRVMIINKGKLVFDGDKEEIAYGVSGKERVYVEVRADAEAPEVFQRLERVEAVHLLSKGSNGVTRLHVECPRGVDLREDIFKATVQKGWTLLELRKDSTSFEDVFQQLTTS